MKQAEAKGGGHQRKALPIGPQAAQQQPAEQKLLRRRGDEPGQQELERKGVEADGLHRVDYRRAPEPPQQAGEEQGSPIRQIGQPHGAGPKGREADRPQRAAGRGGRGRRPRSTRQAAGIPSP